MWILVLISLSELTRSSFSCKGCSLRVSLWDRSTKRLHRRGRSQGTALLGGIRWGKPPSAGRCPPRHRCTGDRGDPCPITAACHPARTNPQLCSAFARGRKMLCQSPVEVRRQKRSLLPGDRSAGKKWSILGGRKAPSALGESQNPTVTLKRTALLSLGTALASPLPQEGRRGAGKHGFYQLYVQSQFS